eukprot:SM000230S07350  [mRNA]  locus=s230:110686:111745:+ [translate_table: standard]
MPADGGSGSVVVAAAAAATAQPSIMEQLVPEVTNHALSYLDFRSLCQLSMTNSVMRRAANDDAAWRALFCKDFCGDEGNARPPGGWKVHYAETRAVREANERFYCHFRAKCVRGMAALWRSADYVKCIHPGRELISGYDAVMESWCAIFSWAQRYDVQLLDVRIRVMGDMAWVTAKEVVNTAIDPLMVTNCFERHAGVWQMVHHHSG